MPRETDGRSAYLVSMRSLSLRYHGDLVVENSTATVVVSAECNWNGNPELTRLSKIKTVACLIFYNLKKQDPIFIIFGTLFAEGPGFLNACIFFHLISVDILHYPEIH